MPRKQKTPPPRPRVLVRMDGMLTRADAYDTSYGQALGLVSLRLPGWGLLIEARPLTPPDGASASWSLSWQRPGEPLAAQHLEELEAQLPLVLSPDTDESDPFVTDEMPDGLVRLRAFRAPLVVTAQQEAELAAILSEPDKEDPQRRAWLQRKGPA